MAGTRQEPAQKRWLCSKCKGEFLYFPEHTPNYCPYCAGGPLQRSDEVTHLRASGVGRDAEQPRALSVYFNRIPTDDELRAVNDCLRKAPAACPFCTKPTYLLPCSHCGEPDTPEGF